MGKPRGDRSSIWSFAHMFRDGCYGKRYRKGIREVFDASHSRGSFWIRAACLTRNARFFSASNSSLAELPSQSYSGSAVSTAPQGFARCIEAPCGSQSLMPACDVRNAALSRTCAAIHNQYGQGFRHTGIGREGGPAAQGRANESAAVTTFSCAARHFRVIRRLEALAQFSRFDERARKTTNKPSFRLFACDGDS